MSLNQTYSGTKFLGFAAFLASGIYAGFTWQPDTFISIATLFFLALLAFTLRIHWLKSICIYGSIAAFGLISGGLAKPIEINKTFISGTFLILKSDSTSNGKPYADISNRETKLRIWLNDDQELHQGEAINAVVKLNAKRHSLPFTFNFDDWLIKNGFSGNGRLVEYQKVKHIAEKSSLDQIFGFKIKEVRQKLSQTIQSKISPSVSGFSQALLLGERSNFDQDTATYFRDTGTLHAIAVSGMHLMLIFGLLSYFLKFSEPYPGLNLALNIAVFVLIWLYAILTGLSSAVFRSAVMFSVWHIGQSKALAYRGRSANGLNSLGIAIFIILLFQPLQLFDAGLHLSLAAMAGIIIFVPLMYDIYIPESKPKRLGIDLVYATLAANIFLIPVQWVLFNSFAPMFLPANLVLVPLTTLGLYTGVAFLTLCWLEPISNLLALVHSQTLNLSVKAASFIYHLPGGEAKTVLPHLSDYLFYFTLLGSIYFFYYRKAVRPVLVSAIMLSAIVLYDVVYKQQLPPKIIVLPYKELNFSIVKNDTAFVWVEDQRADFTEKYKRFLASEGGQSIVLMNSTDCFPYPLRQVNNGYLSIINNQTVFITKKRQYSDKMNCLTITPSFVYFHNDSADFGKPVLINELAAQ